MTNLLQAVLRDRVRAGRRPDVPHAGAGGGGYIGGRGGGVS